MPMPMPMQQETGLSLLKTDETTRDYGITPNLFSETFLNVFRFYSTACKHLYLSNHTNYVLASLASVSLVKEIRVTQAFSFLVNIRLI